MAYEYLDKYSVEELQGYFSDFHKDFYGHRPRFGTPEEWRSRGWLVVNIDAIHTAMDKMKATAEGRAELRANGWVIGESDFDVLERAEELADADAVYFGG